MVLEDSWSEKPPPSDEDSYSSSGSGSSPRIKINTDGFSKPLPIIGTLFGYSDQFMAQLIQTRLRNMANVLQRQPDIEEITALAFWTSKQVSIMSYGPVVGVAGGCWRAWQTADTFRFPFFQPNLETFQKEAFPHARMPILRGNRAIQAWHLARTFSYGACGNFFSTMFFGSYSVSVATVGETSDKRLKDYVEAVRKQGQQRSGKLPGLPDQRQPPVPVGGHGQDDASPTGGMFGGAESESPQEQPQWKPPPQSRPTPVQTQAPEPQSQPFDVFGEDPRTAAQQSAIPDTQASQPRGSAWERLRRGQQSGVQGGGWDAVRQTQGPGQSEWSKQQAQSQRDQKQGSTFGESYSISKTDEERSYAKEEAQREFDAQVERERRAGFCWEPEKVVMNDNSTKTKPDFWHTLQMKTDMSFLIRWLVHEKLNFELPKILAAQARLAPR
ncbi:hypothetical protein LAWI1_G007535 [Lachnellula willkommii]|uniref:Uncharacterized protein n=1 Tax=Lachnellula willkommii TaxID=215461 RepID=A0A559M5K1_9HELO|nr:hypothetical protein LAWI1_G007535 [Lachnellula willkommii]